MGNNTNKDCLMVVENSTNTNLDCDLLEVHDRKRQIFGLGWGADFYSGSDAFL